MTTPDPRPTEQGQGLNMHPHGSYLDVLTTVPWQELPSNASFNYTALTYRRSVKMVLSSADEDKVKRTLPNTGGGHDLSGGHVGNLD